MGLKHVVITAVARDDMADGGADHFRQTIEAVRSLNPGIVIEVLTPDFLDKEEAIDCVLSAKKAATLTTRQQYGTVEKRVDVSRQCDRI